MYEPLMNTGKETVHVVYIRDDGSYDSPNAPQPGFLRGMSFYPTETEAHKALDELLQQELEDFWEMGDEFKDSSELLTKVLQWVPELEDWIIVLNRDSADDESLRLRLKIPSGVERYVEAWDLTIGYSTAYVGPNDWTKTQ